MTARYYFTFQQDWHWSHVAYWVHVPVAGSGTDTDPPAPEPVPHRGYVFLHVEFGDTTLAFSSPAQLDHVIAVLGTKPLPTSRQLSAKRGAGYGPNRHWLSRLPASLKQARQREKVVRTLAEVRAKVVVADERNGSEKFQVLPGFERSPVGMP
ncbi:hypothetical protein NX774_17575 [Massilia agilis]|uniref:Uncharacterized protein n=1 Tax=Massilia agilis TaxID=1811226 RepID=A0ABT2DEI2_9BURK|nr:hypothetical protein [Massilia agilis]MCS0809735.1 hypothetical protein [Massilia agilis]